MKHDDPCFWVASGPFSSRFRIEKLVPRILFEFRLPHGQHFFNGHLSEFQRSFAVQFRRPFKRLETNGHAPSDRGTEQHAHEKKGGPLLGRSKLSKLKGSPQPKRWEPFLHPVTQWGVQWGYRNSCTVYSGKSYSMDDFGAPDEETPKSHCHSPGFLCIWVPTQLESAQLVFFDVM